MSKWNFSISLSVLRFNFVVIPLKLTIRIKQNKTLLNTFTEYALRNLKIFSITIANATANAVGLII